MRLLAETIRLCEIAGIRCGVAAAQRLTPSAGATSTEMCGGLLAFTGADSPLSQAFGIAEPVTDADVAAITDFYESRAAIPRVYVSPLADVSLGRALAAGGYEPCEYENVLACHSLDEHGAYDARIGVAADLDAWAKASACGFLDVDAPSRQDMAVAELLAGSQGVVPLEGRENGRIVATAALDVQDKCAGLFAGSTLSAFRGRGWQLAMIRDRIARARDAGARFARGTAKPQSISERNFLRCGFRALYTRTLWERRRLA